MPCYKTNIFNHVLFGQYIFVVQESSTIFRFQRVSGKNTKYLVEEKNTLLLIDPDNCYFRQMYRRLRIVIFMMKHHSKI